MKAGANSPFANEQGLMNLVSLSMEGDYLGSEHQFYYSNVAFNADTETPFISNTGSDKLGGVVDNYMLNLFKGIGESQEGTYAPVGLTEEGDLFFVNPFDEELAPGFGPYYVYTMTRKNGPDWYKGTPFEGFYFEAGNPAPYKYVDRENGDFVPVVGVDPDTQNPIMNPNERTINGKYLSMFVPVPNAEGKLQTTLGMTLLMPTK